MANDATELAAVADMVLLMAKADRTSRDAARRSTEMLRRVDAPLLGVVVSAAHDTPTAYGYYRYRYYAEADQGGSRASARKARKAAKAAAKEPVSSRCTVAEHRPTRAERWRRPGSATRRRRVDLPLVGPARASVRSSSSSAWWSCRWRSRSSLDDSTYDTWGAFLWGPVLLALGLPALPLGGEQDRRAAHRRLPLRARRR